MANSFPEDYYKINNTGIEINDTSTAKAAVTEVFKAAFGSDMDTSESSVVGRLIESMTSLFQACLKTNIQNANQYNLDNASGVYLDGIGSLFGVSRNAATKTTAQITVSQESGATSGSTYTIPKGLRFVNDFNEEFQYTGDDLTNKTDGVKITVESVDTGKYDTSTLGTVVNLQNGMSSTVTLVPDTTTYGTDIETDEEYRERLKSCRSLSGTGTIEAITKAILTAKTSDGSLCATKAWVFENGTNVPASEIKTKGDQTLSIYKSPHSICVLVKKNGSNTSTDVDYTIAEAIFKTKTAGCNYTHTGVGLDVVTENVTYNGGTYPVYFYYMNDSEIYTEELLDA